MSYKGFKDEKQKKYYERTKDFLNSDKKILVNPGGMGLGKTWATIQALIKSSIIFSFIGVPTAPTKNVWGKDFEESNMNGNYAIWFSKSSCCIKKHFNKKFDVTKNCNDDCKYWSPLQKNGEYTIEAEEELNKLENNLPTFPENYYNKHGFEYCLMPICRLGLKRRKYIIGDYFAFLNKSMFDKVVNSKENLNKRQKDGTLIIDEAHLLPDRAKEFLSKTLNFTKTIEKLKEETDSTYIKTNFLLYYKWEKTIEKLRVINDNIIKRKKENEERYNYENFYDDYNSIIIEDAFELEELKEKLKELSWKSFNVNVDEDFEVKDEPYCSKFLRFLEEWRRRADDPAYKNYFQYRNINKGIVRFIIDCCDTKIHLKQVFRKWDKIILNSGTISDVEWFNEKTGIDSLDVKYEDLLESYSIKDNVLIYSKGKFTSSCREQTYRKEAETLNQILGKVNGRSIIYIQNKGDSVLLRNLIKTDKRIIDFCSKDDGFQTGQGDFFKLKDEFNKEKEAIAIMNINGRVEGFNFQSEIEIDDNNNGKSVDNIIVFGYPFPKMGLSYWDEFNLHYSRIKDKEKVKKWVNYTPVLARIHQASCRAKRKEEDNPVIILWDQNFGSGKLAYKYMPSDLKGEICWDESSLFEKINEIKRRGKNGSSI